MTRRNFLAGSAAVVAGTAFAPACSALERASRAAGSVRRLGDPAQAPFDTVVVLTMEGRSFDQLLGWLPGADGKQAGLRYVDAAGQSQPTWPLAPDWQAWIHDDPKHDWMSVAKQWNGGQCDGFLQTQRVGDQYPIGYYTDADLPALAQLARHYTTLDRYFCALLGPTWPNRFYMHCAATDIDATGTYPYQADTTKLPPPGVQRPSKLDVAIWDRLADKGLTGAYYYTREPITGLFESRRYDGISDQYEQFTADAAAGTLPNVSYVDPNFGALQELYGTSNDEHPHGSVKVGDAFIAEVYDTLRRSPQWEQMVFVLTFGEHGGFFDHVPPPAARDDNANQNPGPHPDYGRLGFRVPCIVMGPFAPKRIVHSGPYEHCSILRMIEWRWNLKPMHARDRYARNLAEVLDFTSRRSWIDIRRDAIDIGRETPPPTVARPANAAAP
jgi:phospholipase C